MIQDLAREDTKRSGTSFHLYCSPYMPLSRDLWWAGAYISNLIFYGTTVRPDYRTGVPIRMAWLKEMLGSKAQPTINQLLDKGVIVRVKRYVIGESPYFYRLVPPYDQCHRVECLDRQLIGKIVERSRQRLPVVQWLERHARLLKIDGAAAIAAISSLQPKRMEGNVEMARECAERCVRLIANGDVAVKLDRTQGRVFAPHVTLPSVLRKHLHSPGGERIVSLDIRNCQPLLLTLALAQFFHPDRKRRHRLLNHEVEPMANPYLWPSLRTVGKALCVPRSSRSNSFLSCDIRDSVHHIERDLSSSPVSCLVGCPSSSSVPLLLDWLSESCSSWIKLTANGQLYESFGNDRERVKEEFIYVLFGERPLKSHKVGQKILSDFPEVAEVINAMKWKNCLVNNDPRPYRYMACMLQLYESTMMIYRTCGRIMRERPDVPVWTIHDCLLTPEPQKGYVERIMREEFAGVGLSPSIKETFL
ncbi:MAG: hypothetical protein ACYC0X_00100 [Pirellulaceae bacterium]